MGLIISQTLPKATPYPCVDRCDIMQYMSIICIIMLHLLIRDDILSLVKGYD